MGQNMQKVQTLAASMMLTGPVPFAPAGIAIISIYFPSHASPSHVMHTVVLLLSYLKHQRGRLAVLHHVQVAEMCNA